MFYLVGLDADLNDPCDTFNYTFIRLARAVLRWKRKVCLKSFSGDMRIRLLWHAERRVSNSKSARMSPIKTVAHAERRAQPLKMGHKLVCLLKLLKKRESSI